MFLWSKFKPFGDDLDELNLMPIRPLLMTAKNIKYKMPVQ